MLFGTSNQQSPHELNLTLPKDGELTSLNLTGEIAESFDIYLGLPKWGDKNWRGLIYPEKSKENLFLGQYAEQFGVIELNATFYSLPKAKDILHWSEQANSKFLFLPKVSRIITHIRRLKNTEREVNEFFESIRLFGDKMGPCFVQLSDKFNPDQYGDLENFLQLIPKDIEIFIELRDEGWFGNNDLGKEVFNMLLNNRIGSIIADTPGRRDCLHMEVTNNQTYVRFMGVGGDNLATDKKRIDEWVERISSWRSKGLRKAYFIIHEDESADSIKLADYTIKAFNKHLGSSIPELNLY